MDIDHDPDDQWLKINQARIVTSVSGMYIWELAKSKKIESDYDDDGILIISMKSLQKYLKNREGPKALRKFDRRDVCNLAGHPAPIDGCITIPEAAKHIGLSPKTINVYIDAPDRDKRYGLAANTVYCECGTHRYLRDISSIPAKPQKQTECTHTVPDTWWTVSAAAEALDMKPRDIYASLKKPVPTTPTDRLFHRAKRQCCPKRSRIWIDSVIFLPEDNGADGTEQG